MFRSVLFLIILLSIGIVTGAAQADDDPFFPGEHRNRKEDPPRNILESLSKMRIEKEKKDFKEMLTRGADVARLAEGLDENSSAVDKDKIGEIGKLVKKVRDDLGGESDDDKDAPPPPLNSGDAIRALKDRVRELSEELQKVDRFTVSAAAIDRTNDILRLVKYLRG